MFRHQVVMSKSPYLWVKIRISHIWQIISVNPTFVPSSMVKSQEKHRKIYHSLFFLPQNHHLKHQGKTTGFPKPELSGVPQGSPAADRVCRVYLSICLSVYPSTHLSIHQPSRSRSRLIHRYHRRSGQRWLPVSKTLATPRVHPKAILVGCVPTPLKNMKVSWDDYSQYMESHKINVPNHQYWSRKKTSTASVRGSIRKRSSVGWLCQF